MEQQNVLLALGVSVLLIVLTKLKSFVSNPKLNRPPGPWTLPVIGSIHHLLASRGSIYRSMRELAEKHGPLMQLWLGEVPTVVATSREAAQEILKTHDLSFSDRHLNATLSAALFGGIDIIFSPYGDRWRELRKICVMELLSTARVNSFRRIREEEVGHLMQDLAGCAAASATVNISEKLKNVINDALMRESIGSRCKHRDEYMVALDNIARETTALSVADLFPSSKIAQMIGIAPRRALAARRRIERVLEQVIQERKEYLAAAGNTSEADGSECILDVLLRLQREGGTQIPMTNETIVVLMFDVFAAGSETSGSTINWTMAELIRTPRVLEKVQAEVREALKGKTYITDNDTAGLTYVRNVLMEGMRLHCPIPLLSPRKCRQTCKIMGYDIPKGTSVFVNVWAICRDNKYWEDAEEFKPERFENGNIDFKGNNYEYLPFGSGRRICPGTGLSMAKMMILLASLLYHFDWKLPDGVDPRNIDMAELPGMVAMKNTPLYLQPVTRIAPTNA